MKKTKAIDPTQRTLQSMFVSAAAAETKNEHKSTDKHKAEPVNSKQEITTSLQSDDPTVQAYYNSLKPNERRAHEIAIQKLGTSYDVIRTHGFLNWQKSRK
jgi:hypothetical protein